MWIVRRKKLKTIVPITSKNSASCWKNKNISGCCPFTDVKVVNDQAVIISNLLTLICISKLNSQPTSFLTWLHVYGCRDPSFFFQSRRLLTKIFKSEVIGNWKCRCCEVRGEGHKTGGFWARYLPFSSIKPGTSREGLTGRFQNPLIWIICTFIKKE